MASIHCESQEQSGIDFSLTRAYPVLHRSDVSVVGAHLEPCVLRQTRGGGGKKSIKASVTL